MARYTQAYSAFIERIREVDILARSAASLEKEGISEKTKEINACCRGAVVLLCSHIEGYIKDIGEVTLDRIFHKKVTRGSLQKQFFYAISRNHFDEIKDTKEPDQIALKIFNFINQDLPFWGLDGPFPTPVPADRFLKGFASPSIGKIGTFFRRFGYEEYKRDMQRILKADFTIVTTMIDNIVSTRNNIAHGNAIETRTPADIRKMLEMSQIFCRTTDAVFCDWLKVNICSIR